ncbi:hypothetical protein H5410_014679 [Solanum commersonii]|uniref:Uncharacterized protein n=1 Tax=Solanum commersonii TaxID=4109 RepID=A0A9J5ZS61_SOLCO|nr:hypothetical protein H5410_014679 [Solanum commersonii]
MQHQPRFVRINSGVCASTGRHQLWPACIGQRHWPITSSISQGLHVSTVSCVHRLWPTCIDQWQVTLTKACMHLMWHVRIGQATSTNDRQHQQRLARISHDVCALAERHERQPTADSISQGLHASDVACALRASDPLPVHITQLTSVVACAYHSVVDRRGLPVSPLAYTQWSADVGRGLRALGRHHQSWPARIGLVT